MKKRVLALVAHPDDAEFLCAGIVNIDTPGIAPLHHIPHLYYVDPLEGKDKFGERILYINFFKAPAFVCVHCFSILILASKV